MILLTNDSVQVGSSSGDLTSSEDRGALLE